MSQTRDSINSFPKKPDESVRMNLDMSHLEYYDVNGFAAEEPCRDLVRLFGHIAYAKIVSIAFVNGTNVSCNHRQKFLNDVVIDLTPIVSAFRPESKVAQIAEPQAVFRSMHDVAQICSIPIFTSSDQIIGVLLAAYSEPTVLSQSQNDAFVSLAHLVYHELEARRRSIQQAVQQEKRAIHTNKLSTLGEMAAGIAHEINNPLAIIQGNLNKIRTLIEKDRLDLVQMMESVNTATRTVGRIVKIVSGLRSFARDEVGEPFQSAEVRQLVEETLAFCHERFKNLNIQITVQFAGDSFLLECRPVQISQVLLNLLMNSFDAITEKESGEKWIRVDCGEDAEFATIRVTDSGLGVSENIQKKVFQPFFTTKPLGKGTGLGLSIARGIIESHHGELLLDASCEHTTFIIRLPKSQTKSQVEVKSLTRAQSKTEAKFRIKKTSGVS